MKKSILSLSAAVALGGLGFTGSANAWVAYEASGSAATLMQHPAGVGHILFTPYYTANSGLATLINIVNTDNVNGKAVKVRFRGATNSDDVLDFTLFLSPADVWTGQVQQDASTGLATIQTPDKSCTIPSAAGWAAAGGSVPFKTIRLPSYVSSDAQAALTREGYVEVLNMADIKPDTALFKATKHVNGVAPCDTLDYANLLSTSTDVSAAKSYGLDNPTGGLMGSWSILNLGDLGTFSGTQTAIIATSDTAMTPAGTAATAKGNLMFFPQIETSAGDVSAYTADPLLSGSAPIIAPLWFDLPDMSTPLVTSAANPGAQADALSMALSKESVSNEYIATVAGSDVPYSTDWVVSQPTRRYHAAMNYSTDSTAATIVKRGDLYSDLEKEVSATYGPQACLQMTFSSTDREEKGVANVIPGGAFSPGSAPAKKGYCGEVFVLQLGVDSPLHAVITTKQTTPNGEAGWGTLQPAAPARPLVGYAATLFKNTALGTSFGQTLQHRWVK